MKNKIKEHYDNLAPIYDQLWFYSPDFVSKISDEIINSLLLSESDVLVDLGCGTGIYAKEIKNKVFLNNDVICVDLSSKMLEQINENGFLSYAVDAVSFSRINLQYNKVLIKEMIHHLGNEKVELINNIYKNISINGILAILLLPPSIEYPLFKKALKYYEDNQPHYSDIEKILKEAGFKTSIEFIKFPLNIEKYKYFNMVKNRYMSLLSNFTDEEIAEGLNEMSDKYFQESSLNFNDVFVVVKGIKL